MMVIGQEVEDALDRRVDLFVEADFVLGHCGFLILSDRTKTLSAPAGESADNAHGSWPDNRRCFSRGGKSGLRRARCQVTPGRREPTESATENRPRSEEHTSELQSLMRISYAVFCLKKKTTYQHYTTNISYNFKQNTQDLITN